MRPKGVLVNGLGILLVLLAIGAVTRVNAFGVTAILGVPVVVFIWLRSCARALTDAEVEKVLRSHYTKMLGTPEGRAYWRDLIDQAEATE